MPANSRDGEGTIDSRNYGNVDNNVPYQSPYGNNPSRRNRFVNN